MVSAPVGSTTFQDKVAVSPLRIAVLSEPFTVIVILKVPPPGKGGGGWEEGALVTGTPHRPFSAVTRISFLMIAVEIKPANTRPMEEAKPLEDASRPVPNKLFKIADTRSSIFPTPATIEFAFWLLAVFCPLEIRFCLAGSCKVNSTNAGELKGAPRLVICS